MGFFTMYMAERVGQAGRVHCVDVQEQMLRGLSRRLTRRGLAERVELRHCSPMTLGIGELAGSIDLAVLIHMLHEVPDPRSTLSEVAAALGPQGKLLLIEPEGHVSQEAFAAELALACEVGLVPVELAVPALRHRRLAALLARPQGETAP
jgi:ubiquinone/menaquinone biosynthesis C-methylase UbiE